MTRTYGLRNANDLFAKLQRDYAALRTEVTSDRVFNFVVTAYHLAEWIEGDAGIAADPSLIQELRASERFQACRDLANASKHAHLDPKRNPKPTVKGATAQRGFGLGRYGAGAYGIGEEQVQVTLASGASIGILDLAASLMAKYERILNKPSQ